MSDLQKMSLQIEYIPTSELNPYPNNARKHENTDVSAIVSSIQEFGFDDPIGVWGDDNTIIEGHGRLMAAKKLKMKEVPCIRLDHLTDEQRRAYALAHNKTAELSEWDLDLLKIELDDITDIDMSEFGFDLVWTARLRAASFLHPGAGKRHGERKRHSERDRKNRP